MSGEVEGNPPTDERDAFTKGYDQALDDVLSLLEGKKQSLVAELERWRSGKWH